MKWLRRATLALLMLMLLGGCSSGEVVPKPVALPEPGDPDVILVGTVVTNDPVHPRAEAVAWLHGKIVAVGDARTIKALAGPKTKMIVGGVVLPGLVDAHAHLAGLGDSLAMLDLTGSASLAEMLAALGKAAEQQPTGWVVGRGWDQNDWPEKRFPTAEDLETAAPGRKVWLQRIAGHAGVASAEAMGVAGVDKNTKDPDGGRIVRTIDGEPSGVFIDNAMALIAIKLEGPSRAKRRERLQAAMSLAVKSGLTGVHDMGVDATTLSIMRELESELLLPLRVYAVLSGNDPELGKLLTEGPKKSRLIDVRAVKFYADGALGSRGAALLAPYSDAPEHAGLLVTEPKDLRRRIGNVVGVGFQPCVHAIGDRANRIVLDAFEARADAARAQRPRIEHAQVIAPEDLPRFNALGVIASMQPTHATSDMPWAPARLGSDRLAGAYAWRTLLDSGAKIAFGSDFPVEKPDVLDGLFAAVARSDKTGKPVGGWLPEQRLTFDEAVAGFSSGAAYASFSEDHRGRIREGYDADFTVLSEHVEPIVGGREANMQRLLDAHVMLTIVGGEVVYRR
jgi:predicted amidohydrolase YtcJ